MEAFECADVAGAVRWVVGEELRIEALFFPIEKRTFGGVASAGKIDSWWTAVELQEAATVLIE